MEWWNVLTTLKHTIPLLFAQATPHPLPILTRDEKFSVVNVVEWSSKSIKWKENSLSERLTMLCECHGIIIVELQLTLHFVVCQQAQSLILYTLHTYNTQYQPCIWKSQFTCSKGTRWNLIITHQSIPYGFYELLLISKAHHIT